MTQRLSGCCVGSWRGTQVWTTVSVNPRGAGGIPMSHVPSVFNLEALSRRSLSVFPGQMDFAL